MISLSRRRAFTKAELVVVIVILAVLAMVAVPNLTKKQGKGRVSRLVADQRAMAVGMESFFADHGAYPASTSRFEEQADRARYKAAPEVLGTTFRGPAPGLATLTTPVAYTTGYLPDTSADTAGITFRYHSNGKGWIMGAWGMDEDESTGGQLMWDGGIERIYDSTLPDPRLPLLTGVGPRGAYQYDPTNGVISPGDVWRVATEPSPGRKGA